MTTFAKSPRLPEVPWVVVTGSDETLTLERPGDLSEATFACQIRPHPGSPPVAEPGVSAQYVIPAGGAPGYTKVKIALSSAMSADLHSRAVWRYDVQQAGGDGPVAVAAGPVVVVRGVTK